MSGHKSFSKVVADWIDDHQWPKGLAKSDSILVVSNKNSDGSVFKFQSAFGDLKVDATFDKGHNSLDVRIQLVAPGHHKGVTVAEAPSYHISAAEGEPILFDLENGYIKGSVSFKYGCRDGRQDILATYFVHLPYTADRKKTVDIAPTEVTQATGFTEAQLQEIAYFTPAELKDVEEKAKGSSRIGQIQTLNGVNGEVSSGEQALLVKFLKDFVVDQDSVVLETYYPPSDTKQALTTDKSSNQWHANVSFYEVLELVASVDPKNLAISATLQARLPIIGRVHLIEIEGSLLERGVTTKLDILVAKGEATFTASKNLKSGKYDLYVETELDIKHVREIKSKGKERITTLPF